VTSVPHSRGELKKYLKAKSMQTMIINPAIMTDAINTRTLLKPFTRLSI
jgi:hypothetical protein